SRFSMARLSRLAALSLWLWPLFLGAQTQPEIAGILERLDRLERENRALTEEVRALRAKLDGTASVSSQTVPDAVPANPAAMPSARLEEKVDIQGQRIEEQAQTKVEASQKFPIRLTGMAVFNLFQNSKQSGGNDYPVVAAATGPRRAGATMRQSILG